MQWSTFLCLFATISIIVTHANAGGTMKIALETYRFEVSLTSDEGEDPVSPDDDVLADIDYVKDYSPIWRLKTSLEQDYENSTVLKETAYSYWPWDGPTNCVSPTRFRFLLCLDYTQSYDPTRKCQLGRVQSQLMEVSRDRFSTTILGRKSLNFGSLMRVLDDGDIITNPMGFDFEEWQGPLRLSVYVNCCGGSRFITDRCEDELTTTLRIRPQPLVGGIQAMRYSVDGIKSNSLTFSVNANCEKDHYGRSCDVYCKIDKPVLEHAVCNSSTGERQCMPGWQGEDCQTDVDECRGLMCKNGGTCQNIRGAYSCICPFGTRGRRCQNRYPVCHLQPCQHQGTCLETTAGALCFCMPGFDGQWCHLLEDEVETSRKVTGQGSRSHGDDSGIASPTPVRTVLVRGNKESHKASSSTWHDWYLAIIFGVFILLAVLLILLFLLYRAKVRQQYKVTIPESTLLPVQALPKTRVFDNAVYERDDESGIIQPNTFQIFYDSKNIVDILNNTNNNNNNNNSNNNNGHPHHHHHHHNNNTITNNITKSKNTSKVDNNKGVLLNASSLVHTSPETSSGANIGRHDYNDNAKVKLPMAASSSRSPKVENKSKTKDSGRRKAKIHNDKEIRPYSVETIERGGVDVKGKKGSQANPPDQQGNFYNIPTQSNRSPIIDRWKNLGGVYSSPKSPRSGQFDFPGPSHQSEYKEPKSSRGDDNRGHKKGWNTAGSYVQYGTDTNMRHKGHQGQRKRKSEFMKSSEIEHEYEDIESDNGFLRHRPTPKPRSVYNVQCETLKRRYAVPDGMPECHERDGKEKIGAGSSGADSDLTFNQVYHMYRRSSDGLLGDHVRSQLQLQIKPQQEDCQLQSPRPAPALKSRFDQPRFSEGDIVYPKPRPIHKHYCSQYDLKRKPLSLYVSPEDMTAMSNKSKSRPNQDYRYTNTNTIQDSRHFLKGPPGIDPSSKNHYSEPRNLRDERFFHGSGSDIDNSTSYLTKPKQSNTNTARSPRGGGRFDFLRPQSRHIYRNTDIEGFEAGRSSPKSPRSPKGWTRPKSGDSGTGTSSFRRKSLINLSSPPKVDRRRRKSEVMSDKLFRKKLTSDLRSDSETSVDKCWWMHDDPSDAVPGSDDESKMVSSSAFV